MRSKINQPRIVVQDSRESISTWVNRPYISNKLREQLLRANVLLVPSEGYADQTDLVFFPSGTEELFHFLRESQREGLSVDICIEDKGYKEIARHADLLFIVDFIVKDIVAPLLVALIADYFIRRSGSGASETTVKSKITVCDEKNKRSMSLSFEGPASDYRDTMGNAIQNFNRSQNLESAQLAPNDQQSPSLPTKAGKTKKVRVKKWKRHRK